MESPGATRRAPKPTPDRQQRLPTSAPWVLQTLAVHWHFNLAVTAIGYLFLALSVLAVYLFCSLTARCAGIRRQQRRRETSSLRISSDRGH
jgi:RsiW-degrading membrane proteinase PrsW (M82 family)